MLNKLHRLRKNKDFTKTFRRSKRIDTANLSFRVANTSSSVTRFGFIVANTIDKRATRRNGIKRRMRAAIREIIDEVKKGHDVIISVKKPFTYPYKYIDIKNQVFDGLKKSELLV